MSPEPRQEVLAPATRNENIRAVMRGGYWWHTFRSNGTTHVLGRIGRVGDCLRF